MKKLFPLSGNERWRELSKTEKKTLRKIHQTDFVHKRDDWHFWIAWIVLISGLVLFNEGQGFALRVLYKMPFLLLYGLISERGIQLSIAKELQGLRTDSAE